MTEKASPKNQPKVLRRGGSISPDSVEYLTAFTVYLTKDLQTKVHLAPELPRGVTVVRAATDHDFDVAALWINKYRQNK